MRKPETASNGLYRRARISTLGKLRNAHTTKGKISVIDYSLRECPFCGNPAAIVDAEPFSHMPTMPTKAITCSSEWCVGWQIRIRFSTEYESSYKTAAQDWNGRKRKNKLTWGEHYEQIH